MNERKWPDGCEPCCCVEGATSATWLAKLGTLQHDLIAAIPDLYNPKPFISEFQTAATTKAPMISAEIGKV